MPEDYEPDEIGDALQDLIDQITEAAEEADPNRPEQTFEIKANGMLFKVTAPNGALPAGSELTAEALGSDELIAAVEGALPDNVKLFKTFRLHFSVSGEIDPETKSADEIPAAVKVEPTRALKIVAEGDMIAEAEYITVLSHDADLNANLIASASVGDGKAAVEFSIDGETFTIAQTKEPVETPEEPAEPEEPEEPEELKYPAQTFEEECDETLLTVSAPEGALPEGSVMKVEPLTGDELAKAVETALPGNVKQFRSFRLHFFAEDKEVEPARPLVVTAKSPLIEEAEYLAVLGHDAELNADIILTAALYKSKASIDFLTDTGIFTIVQTAEFAEIPVEPETPAQVFEEECNEVLLTVSVPERSPIEAMLSGKKPP